MDHLDEEERPHHERELTLSTGAILGIFLGLAVLCGGFFGFGYNMGRKSAPTPLVLNEPATPDAVSSDDPSGLAPKPTPSVPAENSSTPTPSRAARHTPPSPESGTEVEPTKTEAKEKHPPKAASASPEVPAEKPAPIVREAPSPTTTTAGGTSSGNYVVQVAAVSHQEDANLLLGALRARGYSVTARPGVNDSFIHVQVGPFHDKKEADAMRQRLLTDGYNAIVK